MLVGWNVPETNGSPVTVYYIEVGVESGHGASHMIEVDASETQHTIADLKPNTTYRSATSISQSWLATYM